MGIFRKGVRVSNAKEPDQFFEEEFWGAPGALYTDMPHFVGKKRLPNFAFQEKG
jgi:hypothetical protein